MEPDLVQRLRIGIHTSADEQELRHEAADSLEQIYELYLEYIDLAQERANRIRKLEAAFGELMKAWEFWQSQETKNGFSELCAAYWDAKAALAGEKKDDCSS